MLCASQCQTRMESMNQIFSDTATCNSNTSAAATNQRSSVMQPSVNPPNVAQFCAQLQNEEAARNEATCFKGTSEESKNCGMNTFIY